MICHQQQEEVFSFFRAQEQLVEAQEWDKTALGQNVVLSMLQRNTLEEVYESFVTPHPLDDKMVALLAR
jgi:hypothetical protein